MYSEIKKRLALITGASRGIGAAIAREFAAAGFDLILTCNKTMDDLNKLSEEITEDYDVKCTPIQADMGDYDSVEKMFDELGLEELDIVVNNAGISYVGLLTHMTVEEWQRIIAVNLNSLFYVCKNAIPLMLPKNSGRIINISSVWGNVGASTEVAYSASKGGVNSFTKALAKELAPSNIQVNAIACGLIDTSMNSCFSAEDLEAIINEIPADRIGNSKEIAELALQLANSPSYMTGQIITIDGGWR